MKDFIILVMGTFFLGLSSYGAGATAKNLSKVKLKMKSLQYNLDVPHKRNELIVKWNIPQKATTKDFQLFMSKFKSEFSIQAFSIEKRIPNTSITVLRFPNLKNKLELLELQNC